MGGDLTIHGAAQGDRPPRNTELRVVSDATFYTASTGCQWAMLQNDFPPRSTVRRYFYDWRDSGLLEGINYHLVRAAREFEGREASPSAGVIDSQSVKTLERGIRGYDACKKIKGRKRHIGTDTFNQLVGLIVHGAGIQDRDGAPNLLNTIRQRFPWLRHVIAGGAWHETGGAAGGPDRYERMGAAFHEALRAAFLEIAQGAPDRCVVIDADATEDEVAARIFDAVDQRLGVPADG